MTHRFAPALLVLLLAACEGGSSPYDPECDGCGPIDDPPDPPAASCADLPAPSSAPAIEPGTMTTSGDFTILTEGGVVAMQYGSQGGTHIDISAHTFVDPAIALNVGIEVIGDYTGTTETSHAACPSGQWGEVTGRVFDPPWGEAMLRLTLRDGGTDIASTELTILVQE